MFPSSPVTARRETGQGLVEYALILLLVGIVVIVILVALGPGISMMYCRTVAHIEGIELPPQCLTDDITIVNSSYNAAQKQVTITASYKGGYDPNVTLSVSPGGAMSQQGSQYTITFNHSCPCTVYVTASGGGMVKVKLP